MKYIHTSTLKGKENSLYNIHNKNKLLIKIIIFCKVSNYFGNKTQIPSGGEVGSWIIEGGWGGSEPKKRSS